MPREAFAPYPSPPALVLLLKRHLEQFGTPKDGRLFSAVRGGPVRSQEYGRVWKEARKLALSPEQAASPLAHIPYDLRHACVSFWLRSGVSHAEAARRAGQGIGVLQRYYAKVLDGEEERMNDLIDAGYAEHEDSDHDWADAAPRGHDVAVHAGQPRDTSEAG